MYPFLLAAYPSLALLSSNFSQVNFSAVIRPLIVSCLTAGVLFWFFWLIHRDTHRAAFIVAAWLLLFFSYGQVLDVISQKWNIPHFSVWVLAIWFLLAELALFLGSVRTLYAAAIAPALNIVSLGLVFYPLILVAAWSSAKPVQSSSEIAETEDGFSIPAGETPPDIYYIMPEDYGRVDQLQRWAGINTAPFQQFLKDKGFYVADCSQSNYVTSELSLGSTFNMDYLQNLGSGFRADNQDHNILYNLIRYNTIETDLKQLGYKTVAFATGFSWSELTNSDVYIAQSPYWFSLTSFENQLLLTTPLRHLEEMGVINPLGIAANRFRERTSLVYNSVSSLVSMSGPKFVFMHIINPHPPFVFAADGSSIDATSLMDKNGYYSKENFLQGYRDQIPYTDLELEKTISTLISQSTRPLVIILQTDTGPLFTNGPDQFTILNAYYMPGHSSQLYPGISPVNTFRVLLNAYFGGHIPLLNDQSYYSKNPDLYNFSPVPNLCSENSAIAK